MKNLSFLFSALILTSTMAGTFSTFKSGKNYSGDGRWYKNGDHFLFRINEGNSNEENIRFSKNNLNLDDKVKYKICFKVVKDCHLDCSAEIVKTVETIKPWVEAQTWMPNSKGTYNEGDEASCK